MEFTKEQEYAKNHFKILHDTSNIFTYAKKVFSNSMNIINLVGKENKLEEEYNNSTSIFKKLKLKSSMISNKLKFKYYMCKYHMYKKSMIIKSIENIEFISSNPIYFLFYLVLGLRSLTLFFPTLKALEDTAKLLPNLEISFDTDTLSKDKTIPSMFTIRTKTLSPQFNDNCCLTIISINTINNRNHIREIVYDCKSLAPEKELKYKPIILENELVVDSRGLISNPNLIFNKEYELEEYTKYSRMSTNILSIIFAFLNSIELSILKSK